MIALWILLLISILAFSSALTENETFYHLCAHKRSSPAEHLRPSLFFIKVADSNKNKPVFSSEFCTIFKSTILTEDFRVSVFD